MTIPAAGSETDVVDFRAFPTSTSLTEQKLNSAKDLYQHSRITKSCTVFGKAIFEWFIMPIAKSELRICK
jgi:hypothetical protein